MNVPAAAPEVVVGVTVFAGLAVTEVTGATVDWLLAFDRLTFLFKLTLVTAPVVEEELPPVPPPATAILAVMLPIVVFAEAVPNDKALIATANER